MKREKQESSNCVSVMEKVKLGGFEQWISIREENRSNPVLLFLHGGPGGSETPMINTYDQKLSSVFTVVNWDQRGSGKSYSKKLPKETINAEQFLADTHELVLYLKERFKKEKIILLGHSWGTYLGLIETYRHPENILAYVGAGQIVRGIEGEQIGYDYLMKAAKEKGDKRALKILAGKAKFCNGSYVNGFKGCLAQRRVLNRYNGMIYDKTCAKKMAGMVWKYADYSFKDKINYLKSSLFVARQMGLDWGMNVDFPNSIPKVDVPVWFFSGAHDYTTPVELVRKYCEKLEAPSKEFVLFQNSAHNLMYEEPDRFFMEMKRIQDTVTRKNDG